MVNVTRAAPNSGHVMKALMLTVSLTGDYDGTIDKVMQDGRARQFVCVHAFVAATPQGR